MKHLLFIHFIFFVISLSSAQWIQTDGPYDDTRVNSFITNDSIIVVTTEAGSFYRTDLSNRWKQISTSAVDDFVVNGDTVYTIDYGLEQMQFSSISTAPIELYGYLSGSIDYYDNTFYNGSDFLGFSWSDDNGATWTFHNNGLPGLQVQNSVDYSVNAIDHTSNYIIAASWGGIYRNTHVLSAWEEKNTGLPVGYIQFVENVNDTLYIAINENLYSSFDFAESWNLEHSAASSINSFYKEGDTICLGTLSTGIDFSSNNGGSWMSLNNGLTDLNVKSITNFHDTLLCIVKFDGVFEFYNGTWNNDNNGIVTSIVNSLASTTNTVFASAYKDVFKLTSNSTWDVVSVNSPISRFHEVKSENDTLFLSAWDPTTNAPSTLKHMLYSTDLGGTWNSIPNPPYVGDDPYRIEYDEGALYAHEDYKLYKTNDLGLTWSEIITPPQNCNQVVDLQAHNSVVFGATCGDGELLKLDNGQNWLPSISGNLQYVEPNFIAFCDGVWFAHFDGYGMSVSFDEGGSWTYANNGLGSDKTIRDFVTQGQQLFLATNNGVYSTVDFGQNWYPLNNGLVNLNTGSVAILNDTLYVGTYGSGVWKTSIPELNQYLSLPENVDMFSGLEVFPNPSNGDFTLRFDDNQSNTVEVRICSLSGEEVFVNNYNQNSIQFNLDLSPGIYLLSARTQQGNKIIKLKIE